MVVVGSPEEASIPAGPRRAGVDGVVGVRVYGALGAMNTGGEGSGKGRECPCVLVELRMADLYAWVGARWKSTRESRKVDTSS